MNFIPRVRYDFTHEVLNGSDSLINGEYIEKDRRVSILCRSEPQYQKSNDHELFKSQVVSLD